MAERNAEYRSVEGWGEWFRRVLGQFLSVHFVITIIVLFFWVFALRIPLEALEPVYAQLTGNGTADIAENAIEVITSATTAVSGLFTTVLGLVLGHYFGQRGQEATELALSQANIVQENLIEEMEDKGDVSVAVTDELATELESSEEALNQALQIIYEHAPNVEIAENSELGKILFGDSDS